MTQQKSVKRQGTITPHDVVVIYNTAAHEPHIKISPSLVADLATYTREQAILAGTWPCLCTHTGENHELGGRCWATNFEGRETCSSCPAYRPLEFTEDSHE